MRGVPARFVAIAAIVCIVMCGCEPKNPVEAPAAEAATAAESPIPARQAPAVAARPAVDVLATVNGNPLTLADVHDVLKVKKAEDSPAPEKVVKVVDSLIPKEIMAQAAVAAGLDKDEEYKRGLRRQQAMLNTFKREALARLFYEKKIVAAAAGTEADARKYYDANAAMIRAELRIFQILSGDRAKVAALRKRITAGEPFEKVAASDFDTIPPGQTPWDLGYLKYKQVPESWRKVVYAMKPGDVSDVISNASGRNWILKLVARREDPKMTFDNVKAVILDDMKQSRVVATRDRVVKELNAKAKVVRMPAAKAP